MVMTQSERDKRCKEKKIKERRCVDCGNALGDCKKLRCENCLLKLRIRGRQSREWAIKNHFCTKCKKNRVYGTDKVCFECRAKSNATPLTKDQKEKYNTRFKKQQKSLYQQRKEQGICTRCGKFNALPNRAKCYNCLEKDRIAHVKRYNPTGNTFKYREENGICIRCGNEAVVEQLKVCERCRQYLSSTSKRSNWADTNKSIYLLNQAKKSEGNNMNSEVKKAE